MILGFLRKWTVWADMLAGDGSSFLRVTAIAYARSPENAPAILAALKKRACLNCAR
jgi:hypothetical protein